MPSKTGKNIKNYLFLSVIFFQEIFYLKNIASVFLNLEMIKIFFAAADKTTNIKMIIIEVRDGGTGAQTHHIMNVFCCWAESVRFLSSFASFP